MDGRFSPEDMLADFGLAGVAILLTGVKAWRMFSLTRLACGLRPRIALSLTLAGYATLAFALTFYAADAPAPPSPAMAQNPPAGAVWRQTAAAAWAWSKSINRMARRED